MQKFKGTVKKIMDDTFMFGIFNKIAKKVKPFEEYMEYMFEHKKSSPIGSFKNEEKVTPWDLLCCILRFSTRRDIIQSNPMTVKVGVHRVIIFRKELREKSEATAKYCSTIREAMSMNNVSVEERRAGLAISASNSVYEIFHRASTNLLQVFRTISIPHAAAMVQSQTNKNHGRAHKNLVTGRKSKNTIDSKKGAYSEGTATNLCPELRQSLMAASRKYAPKHKKNVEKWMRWKFEIRQRTQSLNRFVASLQNHQHPTRRGNGSVTDQQESRSCPQEFGYRSKVQEYN